MKQGEMKQEQGSDLVARARAVAAAAHAGQTDKAGKPYITHPERVAAGFSDPMPAAVALLHDVVEDSDWTVEALAEEFGPEIAAEVDALSRREGESYEEFVRRAGSRPLARQVKLADLRDNLDVTRTLEMNEKNRARLERYRRALDYLEGRRPTP